MIRAKNDVAKILRPTNIGGFAIINCDIICIQYDTKILKAVYWYKLLMLHILQLTIIFQDNCFITRC